MKHLFLDLVRISNLTENLLYIAGKSLQRRALRNGMIVAMTYGSALLGLKLTSGNPLTTEQLLRLLAASLASYPVGTLLTMLSSFLTREHVDTAGAAQLDLMGDLKRTRMRAHLGAAWSEVFRYEALLVGNVHQAINERDQLMATRKALTDAIHGLPAGLRQALAIENADDVQRVVERLLTGLPRHNRMEQSREAFEITGLYALNAPLPQRVQELECGFDISPIEKWYRHGLFTAEDELLRDFETDLLIRGIRRMLRPGPLIAVIRFLGPGYTPSFWYAWTMRKAVILLGKTIASLNKELDLRRRTPFFGAQHLLWPCERTDRDVIDEFGDKEGGRLLRLLAKRRRKLMRKIFSADRVSAYRLLYRAFSKELLRIATLRVQFDAEYRLGLLRRNPRDDVSNLEKLLGYSVISPRALNKRLGSSAEEGEFRADLARLPSDDLDTEAIRALRIAYFVDRKGIRYQLARQDKDAALARFHEVVTAKKKYTAKLVRLRLYHLMARLQVELYRDLVTELGCYTESTPSSSR
ncbi:MAG: hypothetical protein KDH88_14845 [Chromatiales bacterium]|nr:hypothetical protein [Chromatiales bacterium]